MTHKERCELTHEIERLERTAVDLDYQVQKVRDSAQTLREMLGVLAPGAAARLVDPDQGHQ